MDCRAYAVMCLTMLCSFLFPVHWTIFRGGLSRGQSVDQSNTAERPFVKSLCKLDTSYQLSQYLATDRTMRECISGLERSRRYLNSQL